MAYTKGTSAVRKNCYDIYIKPHTNDARTPATAISEAVGSLHPNDGVGLSAEWATAGTDITGTTDWGMIGQLEAEPAITTEAGEVIKLNDCNDYHASAIINIVFNDLEVTGANLTVLETLFALDTMDVLFYDANNTAASVNVTDIRLSIFPQITGNALNKNNISGTKECSSLSNNFAFATFS